MGEGNARERVFLSVMLTKVRIHYREHIEKSAT
ncbi:hypothetical protein BH10PSE13_BH10PSE13_22900 [soil metagenome]